ncbi:MAG: DotU family type IV/VI secretion system protein [Candidatus Accumulibacter sp.]|jgi:type VI protein secretion system component VasF|nr:DotU family type IV/VI secretion system protein [Accumulibacter sp.]
MLKRFFPLMSEALHHGRANGAVPEPMAELGRRLSALAEEERASPSPFAGEDMDRSVDLAHCRLAVYAWVDEILLTAPRPDAAAWVAQSLQHAYFQTSEAGLLFFERMENLLEELSLPPKDAASVDDSLPPRLEAAARLPRTRAARQELDVYALCLLLGFSGRCHENAPLTAKLREAARQVLRGSVAPPVPAAAKGSWFSRHRQGAGEISSAFEWLLYILLPLFGTVLFGLYCANLLVDLHRAGF